MKKYDYNIVFIDTADAVEVLDILKKRGQTGERFVGWLELSKPSKTLPHLKQGIFEKEI